MLIQLQNGVPVNNPVLEENFKALFPDITFPKILTPEVVEPHGFGMYEFTQVPVAEKYKKVVEGQPTKDGSGIWRQVWNVVDMNDAEKAQADEAKKVEVRRERDYLLFKTDWTQLPDAQITSEKKTEYLTYRQQLRDVTNQPGFPWEINWPTMP